MGMTLAEKILSRNTGIEDLAPGDIVTTKPDMMMIHDIYTPFVVQKLDEMKFSKLADASKATVILDHLMPTNAAKNDPRHYRAGIELKERFGIEKLHIGEEFAIHSCMSSGTPCLELLLLQQIHIHLHMVAGDVSVLELDLLKWQQRLAVAKCG